MCVFFFHIYTDLYYFKEFYDKGSMMVAEWNIFTQVFRYQMTTGTIIDHNKLQPYTTASNC